MSMNIKNRSLHIYGDYGDSSVSDPSFDRCVVVNSHSIALRTYASGREECLVNGTVYAADSVEMIRADLGSAVASEAFEVLTGFWPRDFDRAYRRMYWIGCPRGSGWMDSTRTWFLGFPVKDANQHAELCRRYVKY